MVERKKMYHGSWDVELHKDGSATYKCKVRERGSNRHGQGVQIPKDVREYTGTIPGDTVEITLRRVPMNKMPTCPKCGTQIGVAPYFPCLVCGYDCPYRFKKGKHAGGCGHHNAPKDCDKKGGCKFLCKRSRCPLEGI